MAEAILNTTTITSRTKLVDNSLDTGGKMVLGIGGKYMRHIPSGRVYPYVEEGAKREDVEIFMHTAKGDVKINKPAKKKAQGPFSRDRAIGAFDTPGDKILDVVSE